MFKALGVLLAIYTVYAALRGEVYAKSGMGGKAVLKKDSPGYFWVLIGIYAVLSAALITVF